MYEEYGAWLILLVACGFFTVLGWSWGTRTTQKIFVEVYTVQQESFSAQSSAYEERIMNLRGMLSEKDKLNEQLTKQISSLGGKNADTAKAVSEALNKVPLVPKTQEQPK